MIDNQNMVNKWLLRKFSFICLTFLAGTLIMSCQANRNSVKKARTVNTPTQYKNSFSTDKRGLECKPTVENGVVSLDKNSIVPVFVQAQDGSQKSIRSDAPTAAYRLNGKTCIHLSNKDTYRMCGSSLSNLDSSSVKAVYHSPENLSAEKFDYQNWLFSPYVLDDGSLIALAHSEWHDCWTHPTNSPNYCGKKQNGDVWANAVTLYKSTDSGDSWNRIGIVERPELNLITFENRRAQGKMINFGFFHPSNIIREGNRYYAFTLHIERDSVGRATKIGSVLLSTSNPRSLNWEQVTPEGTLVSQPYSANILPGTERWTQVTVTWNAEMCRYLILFWDGRLKSTTTPSLAKPVFTTPVEVQNQDDIQIPNNTEAGLQGYNYPVSQLDPDSTSNNFETTDDSFFVFMNSFLPNKTGKRNLYRVTARLN